MPDISARSLRMLKRRSEFLAAARGVKAVKPELLLQVRQHQDGQDIGSGFTASKKVGNAVTRNRAKRRMRSLARTYLPLMGRVGCDYVLIARQATANCPFSQLEASFLQACAQAHGRLRPEETAQ